MSLGVNSEGEAPSYWVGGGRDGLCCCPLTGLRTPHPPARPARPTGFHVLESAFVGPVAKFHDIPAILALHWEGSRTQRPAAISPVAPVPPVVDVELPSR